MDIHFIASINNNYLEDIQSVAKQLEDRGCKVKRVMKVLGLITGTIEDQKSLDKLQIEGIDRIEIDREVRPL